jgi:outer membrane protein OmpA-like peptidoglycan-associated protein
MEVKKIAHFSLSMLLLAALPACRKATKQETPATCPAPKEQLNVPMAHRGDYDGSMIFDEAAEELILEEDVLAAIPEDSTLESERQILASYEPADALSFEEPELTFEEPNEKEELAAVIYFPYDKEAPLPDQDENVQLALAKAKEIVKEGKKVACKGHACEWGSHCRVRNMPLSMKRAEGIAHQLTHNEEIPAEAIKVFGVGSEEPVVFEHTKEGQAPNRRVEIYALAS